jgi:hypothetical protein
MSYVDAALVLLGVGLAFNLLMTFGVIRRLKEQSQLIIRKPGYPLGPSIPRPGEPIGTFSAVTVDGRQVTSADLHDRGTVVFLSTSCDSCQGALTSLVRGIDVRSYSATMIVVIVGDADGAAEFVSALRGKATVVVEDAFGSVQRAIGVNAFPAVIAIENGVVTDVSTNVPEEVQLSDRGSIPPQ